MVRSGRLLFSSLGHYETPPLTFSAGSWLGTFFDNTDSRLHARARQLLMRLLKAWKVRDGVFHWEFFDTGDELVFGEIAIRAAGGGISRAIYETYGVHMIEEHVRLQLGLPSAITGGASHASAYGACFVYGAAEPGVFIGMSGTEAVGNALAHMEVRIAPGQAFAPSRESGDGLLMCALRADRAQELQDAVAALKEGLVVRYTGVDAA